MRHPGVWPLDVSTEDTSPRTFPPVFFWGALALPNRGSFWIQRGSCGALGNSAAEWAVKAGAGGFLRKPRAESGLLEGRKIWALRLART